MTAASALTLDRIPRGRQVRIRSVAGEGPVTLRLMEMGILPGALVSVVRLAPLGDPMEVEVTGCRLVMRRMEAGLVSVQDLP